MVFLVVLRRGNISRNTHPAKEMFVMKTFYFTEGKATWRKFTPNPTHWAQEGQGEGFKIPNENLFFMADLNSPHNVLDNCHVETTCSVALLSLGLQAMFAVHFKKSHDIRQHSN